MSTPPTLNQGFAAEVRAELARQGKTPTWLAGQTDLSVSTMHLRLKGASRFTLTEMGQIASALNVTVSELLARAESRAEPIPA